MCNQNQTDYEKTSIDLYKKILKSMSFYAYSDVKQKNISASTWNSLIRQYKSNDESSITKINMTSKVLLDIAKEVDRLNRRYKKRTFYAKKINLLLVNAVLDINNANFVTLNKNGISKSFLSKVKNYSGKENFRFDDLMKAGNTAVLIQGENVEWKN